MVGPINTQRLELLDEAESAGTPDIREVLTAFLLPDLRVLDELKSRDPSLPRFVSRMYSEGSDLMHEVMGRQFAETRLRFYAAFGRALPEMTSEQIAWRLHCVVGIVLYLFAEIELPGMAPMLGSDIEQNLEQLLEVTIPLMTVSEVVSQI